MKLAKLLKIPRNRLAQWANATNLPNQAEQDRLNVKIDAFLTRMKLDEKGDIENNS